MSKESNFWKQLKETIQDSKVGELYNLASKELDSLRSKGREARRSGATIEQNPYVFVLERKLWEQGWIEENQNQMLKISREREKLLIEKNLHTRSCFEVEKILAPLGLIKRKILMLEILKGIPLGMTGGILSIG